MTTPHPTPFPVTTPRVRVLILFVIISDSDDEITTLLVKLAPPSSDRIPALSGYLIDYANDSLNEDLSKTAESLHTQSASTPPWIDGEWPQIPLSSTTSHQTPHQISYHYLLPLADRSSLPSPSLLPSSSRKRLRSPSLPPSPSLSPSSLPLPPLPSLPLAAVPPPPKVIIPETLATTTPHRLRRMVEACRWSFVRNGIDTWRYQEGEPRYEMGESSPAQIHPITARSESDVRIEILEQEFETVRSRAEASEARLQQSEADIRELMAHIKRLEDHFGM
ncbi:hypothetical protein Tco_1079765 [Tanacetum coccineum]|uniref:Uncharacterized protein n=1 Tax=Tanacetum coccineum TaxID=301880 RepID=A0ABQ5HTE2_9ASTR